MKMKKISTQILKNTSMEVVFTTIPHDLITEILSRLPVKVLYQFETVSKQFLCLTRDESFISHHTTQSKKNPIFLYKKYTHVTKGDSPGVKTNLELTSIDSYGGGVVSQFVSPISGPVYTFISSGPLVIFCCAYRMYVCNPSMRDFVRLPRSCDVNEYGAVGFGHCPSSNEFKIVHLFNKDRFLGGRNEMGCEIFTLGDGFGANSGSWRRVQDCPFGLRINSSSVCANGVIYWEAVDINGSFGRESMVLSFDMAKEEFVVIQRPKPSYRHGFDDISFLTGLKGSPCLVFFSWRSSIMEIWMLKGKNPTWVKISCVKQLDPKMRVMGAVHLNDDNEELLLLHTQHEGLMYFDSESQTFRGLKCKIDVEKYKTPCLYYDGFFSLKKKIRKHVDKV